MASRLDRSLSFYTLKQVAERLQVNQRTVRRWIDQRLLKVHKIGGILRVSDEDLRAFLALHRGG
jgi:excisionase family DNA binding protein